MKKIILLAIVTITANLSAQMYTGTVPDPRFNTNTFMDASEMGVNFNNNTNKGLNFPQVNLVTFTLNTTQADGIAFPTYYDGMVVYNTTSGTTSGNTLTTQTAVTPGFYYFYNPNGASNGNITSGVWLPIGGNPRVNVASTETPTNTAINGNTIYARKGTFTTNGTSTAPTAYTPAIAVPASATAGIYRVTVFKAGTGSVFANGVYSYDITNGNLITGSPSMSVVYPAGTYDYLVEYTK